jgi:hypothetical protein
MNRLSRCAPSLTLPRNRGRELSDRVNEITAKGDSMSGNNETHDMLLTLMGTRVSVRKFLYSLREAILPGHSASRAVTVEEKK